MKQTPTKPQNKPMQGWISQNKRSIMFTSLAVNIVFVVGLVAAYVMTHTSNYWTAKMAYQTMQRTCPTDIASRMETKREGDITKTEYYVGVKALESGCADYLIQTAQIDDFRAYPDHAKTSADALKPLSPDKTLQVTIVKSLENGRQLSPIKFDK